MSNTTTDSKNYILTFGYGNRKDYQELIEYFEQYRVSFLVDVRISPRAWSRKWYGDSVEKLCVSKGIKYISKSALGNTSGNAKWLPPDKEEAKKSLDEVAEFACSGTVLLMCAEKDWNRCHRTEVANELEKLVNSPVQHLS
ncbi:MAG: DUF488 domain-containing protein [Cyanobacteria bacterium J06632_19]